MGLHDNLSYLDLSAPKNYDEKIKNTLEEYQTNEPYYIEDNEIIRSKIQNIMWKYAGIVRDEVSLKQGLFEILEIKKTIDGKKVFSDFASYEIRNMILTSEIIINSALKRKASIGAHYRSDSVCELSINGEKEEIKNGKIFVK